MSELVADTYTHEIVSSGGMTGARVESVDEGDQRHVKIEQFWPVGIEARDAYMELAREVWDPNAHHPPFERDILSAVANVASFGETDRFGHMVEGLGYRWSKTKGSKDEVETQEVAFTYPSAAKLNSFMRHLFPNQPTVEFEEHLGDSPEPFEFVETFVERGKILIPTGQPQELNEHARLHVIGWVGMDEKLVNHLRGTLGAYLDRAIAETGLPEVPMPRYERAGEDARQFLNPATLVVEHAAKKLTRLAAEVADAALTEDKQVRVGYREATPEKVERVLSHFFTLFQEGRINKHPEIPGGLLETPAGLHTSAATILARYQTADEQARSPDFTSILEARRHYGLI